MIRPRLSNRIKQLVRERAQAYCEYCLSPEAYSPDKFSIEHITPLVAGGSSTTDNLALACQCCNNHKYNKTRALDPIISNEVAMLFHPRNDNWHKHFIWSDDYTRIIGITPTGCATIIELDLNRESVVNLRRLLLLADEHPPTQYKPQ